MSKPSDGAVKAGRALAAMKDNPELERRIRAACLEAWQTIDEARRRKLKSTPGSSDDAGELAVKPVLAALADEVQRLGFDPPANLKEWARLVRVVERDPNDLRFDDLVDAIEEWIQIDRQRETVRQRLRTKIESDQREWSDEQFARVNAVLKADPGIKASAVPKRAGVKRAPALAIVRAIRNSAE